MKVINGHGLSGPYRNEQEFKTEWIRHSLERSMPGTTYHCIETEETEPGFPDVMKLTFDLHAFFYEMKMADEDGVFKMQKTQPLFFKSHPNYHIVVLVWSNTKNRLYCIKAEDIVNKVLALNSTTLKLSDFKEEE